MPLLSEASFIKNFLQNPDWKVSLTTSTIGVYYFMSKETRIHKLRQETNFTQVPNAVLRDKRISLKTKGMLSLLLSYPDNWEIHKSKIIETVKESRTAVDGCFKELVELGYMKKDRKRNSDGTFSYIYYVSAAPIFTDARFPSTDNPSTDNMHLQRNSEQIKTKQTKSELDILVDADFDFLVSFLDTHGIIHPQQITPNSENNYLLRVNTQQTLMVILWYYHSDSETKPT